MQMSINVEIYRQISAFRPTTLSEVSGPTQTQGPRLRSRLLCSTDTSRFRAKQKDLLSVDDRQQVLSAA